MTREEAITRLKNMAWLYGSAEREHNIEAIDMAISALSAERTVSYSWDYPYNPTSDDLIIKDGKGLQDGLYNIQNGELFKYKAKGGTVRAYKLESVSAEPSNLMSHEEAWEQIDKENNSADSLLTDSAEADKESECKLDLISRADALEQMAQAECGLHYEDCEADNCSCSYIGRILDIPSAEETGAMDDAIVKYVEDGWMLPPSADRPSGKWIDMNTKEESYYPRYKCSLCGNWANHSNYCPSCGARMENKK